MFKIFFFLLLSVCVCMYLCKWVQVPEEPREPSVLRAGVTDELPAIGVENHALTLLSYSPVQRLKPQFAHL